eukprot:8215962-Heterocapsa_arctica.AAC.1
MIVVVVVVVVAVVVAVACCGDPYHLRKKLLGVKAPTSNFRSVEVGREAPWCWDPRRELK